MNSTELLEKFEPMIAKAAWKVSKTYRLEFDDVQAQGYLIFAKTLNKFDEHRASFGTYLYQNLRKLWDYAVTEQRRRGISEFDFVSGLARGKSDDNSESPDFSVGFDAVLKFEIDFSEIVIKAEALVELSRDAQRIHDWLFSRTWEVPGHQTWSKSPGLATAQRIFYVDRQWPPKRTKTAWNELRANWKNLVA